MIRVDETQWSAVWVASAPDALLGRLPLGTRQSWVPAFDATIARTAKDYAAPWPPHGRQRFWSFYLGSAYRTTSGGEAWRHLVPLRVPRGRNHRPAPAQLDLFVWPHAAGAVMTVSVATPGGSHDEAAQAVVDAARTATYDVPCSLLWAPPDNATGTLRAGAGLVIGMLGGVPNEANLPPSPFTVTTVIRGDATDGATPERNDAVWRSVRAMAEQSPGWRSVSLPEASEGRVSMRDSPPNTGGGLYGTDRGRVVWEPRAFTAKSRPPADPLECYHRNLVALAMQIEAHLALLRWAGPKLRTGEMSFEAEGLVRWSAKRLGDLYCGARPGSYSSGSASWHIDDDDILTVLDVWSHFGILDALTRGSS